MHVTNHTSKNRSAHLPSARRYYRDYFLHQKATHLLCQKKTHVSYLHYQYFMNFVHLEKKNLYEFKNCLEKKPYLNP